MTRCHPSRPRLYYRVRRWKAHPSTSMDSGGALFLAAKKGDATRCRALFAAGADIHAKPVRYWDAAA